MTKFTAIIEKSDDGWYVGQVEEMPAAISQGKQLKLLMETNRELLEKEYEGKTIMKEDLFI